MRNVLYLWKTATLVCGFLLLMQGCAMMPNSGPSRNQVQRVETSKTMEGVTLVKVDDTLARKLAESKRFAEFSMIFGQSKRAPYVLGPGDVLSISIWETPPAILFRNSTLDSTPGAMGGTNEQTIPDQTVMEDGTITVPFAGRIKVAGRSLKNIESQIVAGLEGKANDPQVLVRVVQNPSATVSVIGDVQRSMNIALTPKREKILDALAQAGGVTHPLNKMSLQLSRKGVHAHMPLDKIVEDPKQNLVLLPGDVVSAQFQPWTYSVLGAATRNQELPFESSGISLAQALSRTGGLADARADPAGVFIFRFEDAALVEHPNAQVPVEGKYPVVYQVDFNDPTAFFVTQNFPMQDKDVVYVANMPSAELEKFLRMVGMVLTPTLNIGRYQMQVAD